MVFISKDWRSPGELWVKTKRGNWEKVKILQFLRSLDQDVDESFLSQIPVVSQQKDGDTVPHVQVTIRRTREIPYKNTLSEALLQLDFPSACRDIRRFGYTSTILNLLINQNLNHLGGSSQRILLSLLEEVAVFVKENNNTGSHVVKQLIINLRDSIAKYGCWGRPLGSTALQQQNKKRLEKLEDFGKGDFVCAAGDLHELPEVVVREIVLKLNHHSDLFNLCESSDYLKRIIGESRIWRELCNYHFTDNQIQDAIEASNGNFTWKELYHRLKRKHGLIAEKYAEEINLCKTCRTLFWPSTGHTCISTPFLISLKPEDFIKLFSL